MSLTYQNIFDYEAEQFVDHYEEVFGTLNSFSIASTGQADGGKTGWNGSNIPGPFSSGGYSIKVTPSSIIEGQSFRVDFYGTAGETITKRYRSGSNGLDVNDLSDSFRGFLGGSPSTPISSLPHSVTSTFSPATAAGTKNANENFSGAGITFKDDSISEGFELFVIELLSSTNTLLASVHVPVLDANPSASTQPVAKTSTIGAGAYSKGWRYEGPPQLTQVRPGISTVTVSLVAVL